jgi:hypothetical protein
MKNEMCGSCWRKMPPHQGFNGFEVALGQIFETPLAVEQGVVRIGEWSDGLHEVSMVVH